MKSLSRKIVLSICGISIISSILAILVSNHYYLFWMKESSEAKTMKISNEIISILETNPEMDSENYFNRIANMNFQIYVFDEHFQKKQYGDPVKNETISTTTIQDVLGGKSYHGISTYKDSWFVTGYFKSTLENSVGVPLRYNGQQYAVFIRPDIKEQFGEVQILFALFLGLTFIFSITLILIMSRFIVNPIKGLANATNKVAMGDYDIELDTRRKDEMGRLARDFQSMASSIQKLDDMRQEFVSNVSHEIQSPLTSIKGFSKALQSDGLSETQRTAYLKIIENESNRLSSLSKQLLTLAALDKETKKLEKTTFRLDEQLREVLLLLEWQWNEKNINIQIQLEELPITADKALLHQVWVNMLSNAIKFTENDGTITINMYEYRKIFVEISDTGAGIHQDDLPYIFDRFYKSDKARNRKNTGTGLGLAIVKKIIGLHDGEISVESTEGIGTTFIFEI